MIPKVALVQVRRTLSPTVGCLTLDVKDGVSGWSVGEKSQCQHRSEAKKKCAKEKDGLEKTSSGKALCFVEHKMQSLLMLLLKRP